MLIGRQTGGVGEGVGEERLTGGGRTEVARRGDVVHRASGPWSDSVLSLLRHLEAVGFDRAPRVVGGGFAEHLRLLVDGYELPVPDRDRLVDVMIEVAVLDAGNEAREAGVVAGTDDPDALWAITWRTRSAAWMLTHRQVLESALH